MLWRNRVVIPSALRQSLLCELHYGHLGISRMKSIARSYFWWPKLDSCIADLSSECDICNEQSRVPPKEPIHPWVYPSKPFERVHIDYAEFQGEFFLVLVDAFSKWVEVFNVGRDSTTSRTQSCLLEVFSRFGIPKFLISDNGPQFTSAQFQSFCLQNGITHKRTPPYHPSSNGQAERIVQELKKWLRIKPSDVSVSTQLSRFLFSYRNMSHSSTGISPVRVVFSFVPTTRFSFLQPSFGDAVRKRQNFDAIPSRSFADGDVVWVLNKFDRGEKWLKGVVRTRVGPLTYVVLCNGRTRHVHVEHLRLCSLPSAVSARESDKSDDVRSTSDVQPSASPTVVAAPAVSTQSSPVHRSPTDIPPTNNYPTPRPPPS